MRPSVREIIESYNPQAALTEARTIPASWYHDPRVFDLEQRTAFARSWQMVGRVDQLRQPGQYITCELAGEPILLIRGTDHALRGFFNVCRHHAAAIATEPEGAAQNLRCPYHGWTYALDGSLKGAPDMAGVCNFDQAANGLVPLEVASWENWVFVKLDSDGGSLDEFLGAELIEPVRQLGLQNLKWLKRTHYTLECNWKVFVDNFLDGGYHVPHLHKGLNSVLDYTKYNIEIGKRFCLQSSPVVSEGADAPTGAVRKGAQALYYWIYPNFMINWYEGVMDTNLVRPCGINRTEVIFDFYFADISEQARDKNIASIAVSERIQNEDVAICESVQRGLTSRAYTAGRLSVRREAGEHLFHKLLHADLKTGL